MPSFDAEVGKANAAAVIVSEGLDQPLAFLVAFATSDNVPQDIDLDVESQRIQVLSEAQTSFGKIVADLLDGFAGKADRLYDKFDAMNEHTRFEALIAVFSKRSAQERRAARISKLALIPTLHRMIFEAGPLFSLLTDQRALAMTAQARAEDSIVRIIEMRKSKTVLFDDTHRRGKELSAQTAILQRKIAASADETVRAKAEADCAPLVAELQDSDAKERSARADLDVLERSIALFETLIESLNQLVAGHVVCLSKLGIETERCLLLLGALGGSPPALTLRDGSSAGQSAHLAELIELHAQNSVSLGDVQRRKTRIDEAFARRFRGTT
jgi:hypothetical protein